MGVTLVCDASHRWLPPVALMALIFFLSAQPDLSSGLGLGTILLRKLAHASVYAALSYLWWRALRDGTRRARARWPRAWLIAIAVLGHRRVAPDLRHGPPRHACSTC